MNIDTKGIIEKLHEIEAKLTEKPEKKTLKDVLSDAWTKEGSFKSEALAAIEWMEDLIQNSNDLLELITKLRDEKERVR